MILTVWPFHTHQQVKFWGSVLQVSFEYLARITGSPMVWFRLLARRWGLRLGIEGGGKVNGRNWLVVLLFVFNRFWGYTGNDCLQIMRFGILLLFSQVHFANLIGFWCVGSLIEQWPPNRLWWFPHLETLEPCLLIDMGLPEQGHN